MVERVIHLTILNRFQDTMNGKERESEIQTVLCDKKHDKKGQKEQNKGL